MSARTPEDLAGWDPLTHALLWTMTANVGAYPVFTFIPDLTLFMGVGVYKFKNVDLSSTCVFTNTTTVAAWSASVFRRTAL